MSFFIIFMLDFFILVNPNTDIFTFNHLIYGNQWGYLTEYGRLINIKDINGEFWRLITVIFLHGGIAHLIVNAIAIGIVGVHMEKRVGKAIFIYLFMICGFVSAFFTMFVTHGAVGPSGAIYGIIGSYIVLILKNKIDILNEFKIMEIILLILYLVLPNLSSFVSVIAHFSGLICGVVCSLILDKKVSIEIEN